MEGLEVLQRTHLLNTGSYCQKHHPASHGDSGPLCKNTTGTFHMRPVAAPLQALPTSASVIFPFLIEFRDNLRLK